MRTFVFHAHVIAVLRNLYCSGINLTINTLPPTTNGKSIGISPREKFGAVFGYLNSISQQFFVSVGSRVATAAIDP